MIKKITFWLQCSRAFALPITILSWLVVFVFGLLNGGDIINGILALIGVSFAHLAGNMADDYIDYGILSKDEKLMNSAVATKCCFIRDGSITLKDLAKMIAVFCFVAILIGVILFFRSGFGVFWLMLIGGILTLTYAKFSLVGLSEVVIGLLFGPLMFEGVWYVMKGNFSLDVLILSLAVVMFTVAFLYIHTLLDFDCDKISHKKTLCCRINDKNKALILFGIFVALGYIFAALFGIKNSNYWVFLSFLTIPFACYIYRQMKRYNTNQNIMPEIRWWNYPLDNWEAIRKEGTEAFYFILFQARNLMMWFCILFLLAMILTYSL